MRHLVLGLAVVGLAGCTTYGSNLQNVPGRPVREVPVSRPAMVSGTGPEAQDVVAISDQMVRSLLSTPVIANADHPPTVAVLPVENKTRFPINADIFVSRLRAELNSRAAGRMVFLARNRIDAVMAERDLRREHGFTADPSRLQSGPAGADYFLTGTMEGISRADAYGRMADYILYQFQLIDSESSAIVWEDMYDIQRAGQNDAVYR
jgi:PBP1b-binding outer membrane lipoprotein LpoB